ncbi:MAG: SOS response-associated peptidase [Marinilabiliales bacterium]|nr:MAG: SOS response-associated peptidase [Marinilabiliales bacterium]
MCYHYSIARTATEIAARYGIEPAPVPINPEPVYYHVNGFNHNPLPVVYKDVDGGHLKLEFMRWGLVPGWVKGEDQAMKMRSATLNARAETVADKPSFRAAFRYRPCLVPATGYFEWMHHKGKKYPFFIHLPGRELFSFAGVWEEWINEQSGEILRSYSIITCDANPLAARIHNTKKRMPAILSENSAGVWLETDENRDSRLALLKPYEDSEMDAYSISRLITSRNKDSNSPEVTEPYRYPELN